MIRSKRTSRGETIPHKVVLHYRDSQLAEHWHQQREKQDALRAAGKARLWKRKRSRTISLVCPYNLDFTAIALDELEGHWNSKAEIWSFPVERRAQVAKAVRRVFGANALSEV